MKKLMMTASVLFLLSACGGGGGGGGHDHRSAENTTRQASGVWHGSLFVDGGDSRDLTLLVLDGVVAGISYESGNLYSGHLLGTDDFLSADLTEYDPLGEPVNRLLAEGVFEPEAFMELGYEAERQAGEIELAIDPITYAPASLRILAGHYQDRVSDIDLQINESGDIDGSDLAGCLYDGHATVAREGINVYEMHITRTGCADAASITALATHYGQGVVDVFVVDSNEHMELWEISDTDG